MSQRSLRSRPDPLQHIIEQFAQLDARFGRLRMPPEVRVLIRAVLILRRSHRHPEGEYREAGRFIYRWLGSRLIHSKRFKMLERELQRSRKLLEERVLAALFEAIEVRKLLDDVTPAERDEARRRLVNRVTDLMSEDVRGKRWRTASRLGKRLQQQQPVRKTRQLRLTPSAIAQIEARLTLRRLAERAHLTTREREMLALMTQGHTIREAAQALGITESTGGVLIHTARRKLRRAAGLENGPRS